MLTTICSRKCMIVILVLQKESVMGFHSSTGTLQIGSMN